MVILKAHFDGRVLVPEEPVDLPVGRVLEVRIQEVNGSQSAPHQAAPHQAAPAPLAALADWAAQLPDNPNSPTDLAVQHDHYLYGTPKRP